MHLARIAIRDAITPSRLHRIPKMVLPPDVKRFLQLGDIISTMNQMVAIPADWALQKCLLEDMMHGYMPRGDEKHRIDDVKCFLELGRFQHHIYRFILFTELLRSP